MRSLSKKKPNEKKVNNIVDTMGYATLAGLAGLTMGVGFGLLTENIPDIPMDFIKGYGKDIAGSAGFSLAITKNVFMENRSKNGHIKYLPCIVAGNIGLFVGYYGSKIVYNCFK